MPYFENMNNQDGQQQVRNITSSDFNPKFSMVFELFFF